MKYGCNSCGEGIVDRPSLINDRLKAHARVCQAKGDNKKIYPHSDFTPLANQDAPAGLEEVFSYLDALNHRNNVILPLLQALNGGEKGQIPTSRYVEARGGVKKKFFPDQAVVVAGDLKTAIGDYAKEDQVFNRAGGGVLDPHRYLSFQESLEGQQGRDQDEDTRRLQLFQETNAADDHSGIRRTQMRRVSVYGGFSDRGTRINNQYYCTLENFVREDRHAPTQAELVSAIHQIVAIHSFLYLKRIKHGDMHMGNIKVIRVDQGVLLKAFDFGKAKVKSLEKNYTRDDLRYLLFKKAIGSSSGVLNFFETKSRANRGEEHEKQLKHYPLHKISKYLIDNFDLPYGEAVESRKYMEYLDGRIQRYGNQLMENLKSSRVVGIGPKNVYEPIQTDAIRNMFELFSNQIVCNLYQKGL